MSKKPLSFTNTRVPYFSNGIEFNHFEGVEIKDFKGSGSPGNTVMIFLLITPKV
jgi:hypothetical protein